MCSGMQYDAFATRWQQLSMQSLFLLFLLLPAAAAAMQQRFFHADNPHYAATYTS